MDNYIEIPPGQLSEEVLRAVIEEFITREGTDYGLQDYSLEQKVLQVKRQLDSGRVVIAYDPVSESCTLLAKD
ncbi:MAG: YheU family protein [Oceanicoccus sp.]|uniref:YheU family protein n=1 Tax=Oceanicoccus sp. TaxID=2691044 RepID=UPI00260D0013|nr:YheU family protein [Oceanicoccus sp.]MDG1772096.1 YheU family protein [Oceanicoccus sp.]